MPKMNHTPDDQANALRVAMDRMERDMNTRQVPVDIPDAPDARPYPTPGFPRLSEEQEEEEYEDRCNRSHAHREGRGYYA